MKLPTLLQFWQLVEQSGLLSEQQFAQAQEALADVDSVKEVARQLVLRHGLTRWQVEQLLLRQTKFYLGKYQLLEQLGQGGMGKVFKARRGSSPRKLALKVMRKKSLQTPNAIERFHREVQTLAALNHPNIIAAIDAESAGDTHFLVMEYVEGWDLNHWVKYHFPLPLDWVCECIRQAALGLQYAHERGLVHRDIKPGNVLVVAESVHDKPLTKLLDLGMARFSSEGNEEELAKRGHIMGTPDYIAPEQARNAVDIDPRSDIFSLGCTLFKVVTGEVPFSGDTSRAKLKARLKKDAPKLSSRRSDVSQGLDAVVTKMLAREPKQRFQTPGQVAIALEPFCGEFVDLTRSRSRTGSDPSMVFEDDEEDTTAQIYAFFDQLSEQPSQVRGSAPSDVTHQPVAGGEDVLDAEASGSIYTSQEGGGSGISTLPPPTKRSSRSRQGMASSLSTPKPQAETTTESTPQSTRSPAKTMLLVGAITLVLGLGVLIGFLLWDQAKVTPVEVPEEDIDLVLPPEEEAIEFTRVEWDEFPLGNKYTLTFTVPQPGRYRLLLHLLEGDARFPILTRLDDSHLRQLKLRRKQFGPDSSFPLGTRNLLAGPHELELELEVPEDVSLPQPFDFAISYGRLPE